MPTVNLSSFAGAGWQFFDNNGVPLAGGLIYTYTAGTSTPATTYTTSAGSVANSNPIVLDSAGRTPQEVWLPQLTNYKFVLKNSSGDLIGTYDNLPGVNDTAYIDQQIADVYSNFANTTDVAKGDALVGFKQSNSAGVLTGAVARTVHQKFQEFVSIKDFGAVGDGTTDDTAAIQAAVDYVCSTNISSLFFPFGSGERYKLTSTIIINRANIALIGNAGLSWTPNDTGYIFSNVSGLTFFDFGNNSLTVMGAYGLYHMSFYGGGYPYNGSLVNTQVAVKFSDSSNGPSRNVPIRDCTFNGFYKAINLDNTVVTDTIAPSWIDIQDCWLSGGTYAVYGNPSIPQLGLRFVNNISEQGAKISGNFSSHCEITNNLIEGQTNFLKISGIGGTHLIMRDNYFEVNDGDYIADVGLSNSASCVWELDYGYTYRGTRTDDFVVAGGGVICKGNTQSTQVTSIGQITFNSLNVYSYKVKANTALVPTSILPAEWFVGAYSDAIARSTNTGGSVTVQAPHGQVTTATTITTSTFLGYFNVSTTYSAGDLVTVTFLVRTRGPAPTNWQSFFIQVLNDTYNPVVAAAVDGFFNFYPVGQWALVTMSMAAENAGTVLRVRTNPYYGATASGDGIDVAGYAVNVITSPASREIVYPLYPVI